MLYVTFEVAYCIKCQLAVMSSYESGAVDMCIIMHDFQRLC